MLAHRGVGRLQCIVPVAMTVCGKRCPGYDPATYQCQCLRSVLPHCRKRSSIRLGIEKRDAFFEDARIAGRDEILRQRQDRPEHDVAVRIAGTHRAVAFEEHEPLRPVAVRLLRPHDANQQIANRSGLTRREQ